MWLGNVFPPGKGAAGARRGFNPSLNPAGSSVPKRNGHSLWKTGIWAGEIPGKIRSVPRSLRKTFPDFLWSEFAPG